MNERFDIAHGEADRKQIQLPLETEMDWASKQARGYAYMFLGVILVFVGIGAFFLVLVVLADQESWRDAALLIALIVAIPLALIGCGLAWYGNQLYEKAKHVAWTKEALREHDCTRTPRVLHDVASEPTILPSISSVRKPPGPVAATTTAKFCWNCGARVETGSQRFCANCGTSLSAPSAS